MSSDNKTVDYYLFKYYKYLGKYEQLINEQKGGLLNENILQSPKQESKHSETASQQQPKQESKHSETASQQQPKQESKHSETVSQQQPKQESKHSETILQQPPKQSDSTLIKGTEKVIIQQNLDENLSDSILSEIEKNELSDLDIEHMDISKSNDINKKFVELFKSYNEKSNRN